jgi:hypothetical protein
MADKLQVYGRQVGGVVLLSATDGVSIIAEKALEVLGDFNR